MPTASPRHMSLLPQRAMLQAAAHAMAMATTTSVWATMTEMDAMR